MNEVICHEICHLVADMLGGDSEDHGERWKECMRIMGFVPTEEI
jgi:predicted SprT family Zn-dependent metalloprotease